MKPLHEHLGVDVSDAAIRKAVEEQNEISRLITEIGEYRKEESPRITGYEFAIFCLATYCCPKYLILDKLRETAEELKTRVPDPASKYRARVAMVGSEIDDPSFIKLAEDTGLVVVADRYCFGSLPGRQEIVLTDDEDALTQVCRYYMQSGQCPRYLNTEKVNERHAYVDQIAKEYKADGIIIEQIKFCDYWDTADRLCTQCSKTNTAIKCFPLTAPTTRDNRDNSERVFKRLSNLWKSKRSKTKEKTEYGRKT